MHGQSLSPFPTSVTVELDGTEASPTPNPQPEASSVGHADTIAFITALAWVPLPIRAGWV